MGFLFVLWHYDRFHYVNAYSLSLASTRRDRTESEEMLSTSGFIASAQSEDREIKLLRSQIKMNEAFNGIKFDSVEWEVTHTGIFVCLFQFQPIHIHTTSLQISDDIGLLRKYNHTGSVYGFSFHVQFLVREEKVHYICIWYHIFAVCNMYFVCNLCCSTTHKECLC